MNVLNLRGEQGGQFINDTDATTPPTGASGWAGLQVITETVIAAITMPDFDNASDIQGETLSANTIILGKITSITLTSGIVQMFNYKKPGRIA